MFTARMSAAKAFFLPFVGVQLTLTHVLALDFIIDVLAELILFPFLLVVAIVSACTHGSSVDIIDRGPRTFGRAKLLGVTVMERALAEPRATGVVNRPGARVRAPRG